MDTSAESKQRTTDLTTDHPLWTRVLDLRQEACDPRGRPCNAHRRRSPWVYLVLRQGQVDEGVSDYGPMREQVPGSTTKSATTPYGCAALQHLSDSGTHVGG